MARWVHRSLDTVKISLCRVTSSPQINSAKFAVGVLLLLGLALRISVLVNEPLHQDEALYGYWGRLVSSGQDVTLATVPVDKPPLVPYLIAASQLAFGVSEFANRLPVLAASILSIPLLFVLARRLYRDSAVAGIAAAVMAVTPYPILMGATTFTDPVLVAWWLASCWCALGARWGWAGITLAMAFASKQHAVMFAPLVLGLGVLGYWTRSGSQKWYVAVARFVAGLAPVLLVTFAWDALRQAEGAAVGFWSQGVGSYGGLRFIMSPELAMRLDGWAQLHGYVFSWQWFGLVAFFGVLILIGVDLVRWRRTRAAWADLLLFCFAAAYLFLHWLLAFPVWDRYLFPLVPVFGLLLARATVLAARSLRQWALTRANGKSIRRVHWGVYGAVLAALLAGGIGAAQGLVPIGGDHGAYDGLVDVAAYVRTLPVGTVLYDRWLSWHYDFYLHGAYVYRAGFPSPEWLARDAAAFVRDQQRVLVVPSWESPARLKRGLAQYGLGLYPAMTAARRDGSTSFVVYEIGIEDAELVP